MVYVSTESRLSRILGVWTNGGYLLVSDYDQQKVYQLKPDSGEMRVIPLHSCHPTSLTVDPSNNCFYVLCEEKNSNDYGHHIRKKTFDGKVDEVIYNAAQGKERCLYCYRITLCLRKVHPFYLPHSYSIWDRL